MRSLERLAHWIKRSTASLRRLERRAVKNHMESTQDYARLIPRASCFVPGVFLPFRRGPPGRSRSHAGMGSPPPPKFLIWTRPLRSGVNRARRAKAVKRPRQRIARRPVSRVLSARSLGRADAPRGTTIPLGRALQRASRDQPGWRNGNVPEILRTSRGSLCHPYSVLLPVGFTLPPPLPEARCALAAPFHPCPQDIDPGKPSRSPDRSGGLFSVALSLGSPPPAVSRHRIPVEPGLSSMPRINQGTAAVRPSDGSNKVLSLRRRQADSLSDCGMISEVLLQSLQRWLANPTTGRRSRLRSSGIGDPNKHHRPEAQIVFHNLHWFGKSLSPAQRRREADSPLAPCIDRQRAARVVSAVLASKPPGASTPSWVTLPSSATRA